MIDFKKEIKKLLVKYEKNPNIEIPPNKELGDYAFPCFELAKKQKKNPIEISKDISSKLKPNKYIKSIKFVGPYVNFFINENILAEELIKEILKKKNKFGSQNKKEKIMVEFSQPNTHKAFHIGHLRGTSFGESISRILEFSGNKVIRANYMGDTGMHIAKWIWCYKKYHSKEKLRKSESWIAHIYVDAIKRLGENEKFQEEVEDINRRIEEGKDKKLMKLLKETRKFSLDSFKEIYKELDTKFDRYYFESEVEKKGKEIAKDLLKRKIAEISDEAVIMNLEKYNLGVWILLRKDGTVLYSAKDLALGELKFKEYNISKCITPIGAAQLLHTKQITKTLELMKFSKVKNYVFLPFSEVRLPQGKMSSRTGENILYSSFKKEMLDYVREEIKKREINPKDLEKRAYSIAISAIKYSMLKQDRNKTIVFDKENALNSEGDTGPYLLYSYARAKSILRKSKHSTVQLNVQNLNDSEKSLILELYKFPEIVQSAYNNLDPSLIANYSFNLCQSFNEFYHNSKVIGSENMNFRLKLVEAFSYVLRNSLYLLGIKTIDIM